MGKRSNSLNEITFVGHLGTTTSLRAERLRGEGLSPLIANGEVEERQVDPETGRPLRCDIRLNSASGRKLASGEMKRPEVAEGRDVTNEALVNDARRKALARGLPYYFTCNMARVALYSVASRPGQPDQLEPSGTTHGGSSCPLPLSISGYSRSGTSAPQTTRK